MPTQHWFWYSGFGGGWWVSQREGGSGWVDVELHWEGLGISCHAGGRGGRGALCRIFVLTAVMHGVAGDDHRWGHRDGSAAHGELVGDGIVSTAAAEAWLARSGSWRKINTLITTKHSKWRCLDCAFLFSSFMSGSLFCWGPTLDYSCAHNGAHPGVGVVYNPCVHWNQAEKNG